MLIGFYYLYFHRLNSKCIKFNNCFCVLNTGYLTKNYIFYNMTDLLYNSGMPMNTENPNRRLKNRFIR